MANLRDIRRRIGSVRSTQKITRAMKMVAAAKLRRAQETILRARPYAYHMRDVVNNLALRCDRVTHPLLATHPSGKAVLIVITSDRGLCGSFNANIVNQATDVIAKQFTGREVELLVIGRKGIEAFRRRALEMRATWRNVLDGNTMRTAGEIVGSAIQDYARGDVEGVYCLYNEFKSAISQRVALERLLPFEPSDDGGVAPIDYVYEPEAPELLEQLLSRHLAVQMHRMIHESAASEFGARMTAMDAATKNAGDVIDRLTLRYNRARQTAITTEMIDIVSGAEAL